MPTMKNRLKKKLQYQENYMISYIMYLYSIMQLIEQITLYNIIFATDIPNCII